MPDEIIGKWMKRVKGLGGGTTAHFVLVRDKKGIFITVCGKANALVEKFADLTDIEMKLIAIDSDLLCRKCNYSPRSKKPWRDSH
jgi:hypothetical protein